MSEEQQPKQEKENQSGFLAYIGISQSTFINQQFNKALWKCFNYYHAEFAKQYKSHAKEINIPDFFESGETHQYQNMKEVELHCMVKMKEYTESHFKEEQEVFVNCRKECESGTSDSGKIMAFVRNEKCYKRCRIDFDKLTKDKVAIVFSKYVPQLKELTRTNNNLIAKQEEDKKITEIYNTYGKSN